MRKSLIATAIIVACNAFINILNAQQHISEKIEEMNLDIEQFLMQWNLPGGTVAFVKEGKLVYLQAFGNADVSLPTQKDHLFRIASLSKPITALAIMKLVEEKKISLEDKVFGGKGILNDVKYLRINDSRIEKITVKQLLQHTGGWDRNGGSEGDPMFNEEHIASVMGLPADNSTIICYMLTKKLDFEPGSKFSYSNFGYNVLGRVIEKVSQMTYNEYIQKVVLGPLDISNMSLACNLYENKQANEVVYHVNQKEKFANTPEHFPYGTFNIEAMDAHGGWIASATDLTKIIIASNGTGTFKDIVPHHIVAQMLTPSDVNNNYGLGWCVDKAGKRWHSGSLIGASSMMASMKNGIGGVFLFNGNPLSNEYFKSMDTMMWKALNSVKELPSYDLLPHSFTLEDKPLTSILK